MDTSLVLDSEEFLKSFLKPIRSHSIRVDMVMAASMKEIQSIIEIIEGVPFYLLFTLL